MGPKIRPMGVTKKGKKKGQKLSCAKLANCPDHPRRRRPLKFCMRGRVREVVIYFKFHENRSRGLGAVEGRKSPSLIDKAHGLYNSLYCRTSRDAAALQQFGISDYGLAALALPHHNVVSDALGLSAWKNHICGAQVHLTFNTGM